MKKKPNLDEIFVTSSVAQENKFRMIDLVREYQEEPNVCPVLRNAVGWFGDILLDEDRQELKPFAELLVDTEDDNSQKRAGFLVRWVINFYLPLLLEQVDRNGTARLLRKQELKDSDHIVRYINGVLVTVWNDLVKTHTKKPIKLRKSYKWEEKASKNLQNLTSYLEDIVNHQMARRDYKKISNNVLEDVKLILTKMILTGRTVH